MKAEWRTYMLQATCAPLQGAESRASMAIYHLSASIVKRSAGRSVVAAAAYRAAAKIEDITTGLVHNYSRKNGVDYSEIISPISVSVENEWLTNRQELWNKIEKVEKRKDAQLAREITLALPIELPREQQIALVREYVQGNYVAAGMIADINIHHIDGNNPHAHILLTMRDLQITPDGTVEFGQKNTDWNSKNLLFTHRKSWEEITNKYLANYGLDIKIDCRSLENQDSPYIPQIHVGVHAMAMHRKGKSTDRRDEFERIKSANNDIRAKLEGIYQQEYTEPELEVKPELTEEQKQQIASDRKLAELIIEVMSPKSTETQTFGEYTIKPYSNGYKVRTNNNHNAILNLKLEDDIWVKSIRYQDKMEERKHIYSNSDVDAKVDDFIKVIAEHKSKIDDLKIKAEDEKERIRAEKEKAKAEAEVQKVNNAKARAEAQIRKVNNELLKPQRAEERRVKMEAQKLETIQRNLRKAEDHAASKIIANAEREVRLAAQKIEYEKGQIERDKIKEQKARLAYETRKIERERVVNEINKAAENISHLLGNAESVEFDVEDNTLEISRNSEKHMTVYINKYWYELCLYSDGNWNVEDDWYSRNSFNDRYKTIEKCTEVGRLIYKREKELEPVTPLLEEELIVSESKVTEVKSEVIEKEQIKEVESEPVTTLLEKELTVSESKEVEVESEVIEEKQIVEVAKVQQTRRKNTKQKKRGFSL